MASAVQVCLGNGLAARGRHRSAIDALGAHGMQQVPRAVHSLSHLQPGAGTGPISIPTLGKLPSRLTKHMPSHKPQLQYGAGPTGLACITDVKSNVEPHAACVPAPEPML